MDRYEAEGATWVDRCVCGHRFNEYGICVPCSMTDKVQADVLLQEFAAWDALSDEALRNLELAGAFPVPCITKQL